MKELKFKEQTKEKYVEDILDTDLVGLESSADGTKYIIVRNELGNYIAICKKDKCTFDKVEEESKREYIEQFIPKPKKVILFDSESEMMIWYNDK